MINCNWMVVQAVACKNALVNQYNYSRMDVEEMSLREAEKELKKLGFDFKTFTHFKNK